MRYVVKLSMEEAEALGIVRCAHCGHPRNNHFSWGPKYCAHDGSCPGFKVRFTLGRSLAKGKRRAKRSPIHRTG